MSQSGTPHNIPSVNIAHSQSSNGSESKNLDNNYAVTDSNAANTKELLNAYVYDFLIKSSLPQTAKVFVNEAEVPTVSNNSQMSSQNNNFELNLAEHALPNLNISMDAPQGFLYEWWQIFWDVFNARTHRGGSNAAQHYFQMQLQKQRQDFTIHTMAIQAAHIQAQQVAAMSSQSPLRGNQPQPQTPAGINGNPNIAMNLQHQQQNSQILAAKRATAAAAQVQGIPPNRIQQHAVQNQMNNLRQQAAAAASQQQHTPMTITASPSKRPKFDNSTPPNNMPINSPHTIHANGPQGQPIMMNQFDPQYVFNKTQQHTPNGSTPNGGQFVPNQPQNPMMANFQPPQNAMMANPMFQQQQQQQHPNQIGAVQAGKFYSDNGFGSSVMLNGPGQQGNHPPNSQMSPSNQQQNPQGGSNGSENNQQSQQPGNINALQDYQMQLMLLEKQNRKRLDIAKNTTDGIQSDSKTPSVPQGNGMNIPQLGEFSGVIGNQNQNHMMMPNPNLPNQSQGQGHGATQGATQGQGPGATPNTAQGRGSSHSQTSNQVSSVSSQSGQPQDQSQSQGQTANNTPSNPTPNGNSISNNNTVGPNQHNVGQILPPQNALNKTTPSSSPAITNQPAPSPGSRKKKEVTRRGRKPSVKNGNGSEPPTPTTPLTPSAPANSLTSNGNNLKRKKKDSTSLPKDMKPEIPQQIDPNLLHSPNPITTIKSNREASGLSEEHKPTTSSSTSKSEPEVKNDSIVYQNMNPPEDHSIPNEFLPAESAFLADFPGHTNPDEMDFDFSTFLNDGSDNGGGMGFEGVLSWCESVEATDL